MATYITFQGGNGGSGGGSGGTSGGGSPALSPQASTNGQNREQNRESNQKSGTTSSYWGQSTLYIRRENVNIDIGPVYASKKGYITIIPTSPMPRRILLTANCYYYGGNNDNYKFSFIIDLLLVPRSFYAESCYDLYQDPYNPEARGWYMGTRSLRNNIIRLRRFAAQGDYLLCAAEQCEVPEELRGRDDYRLILTCPTFHEATGVTARGLYVQLEMEF